MRAVRILLALLPLLLSCSDSGLSGPPASGVTISTSSLPAGAVQTPYTATLTAEGGTGSHGWSLENGSLPAGLALSMSGTITGTPTTPGTSSFTVRATSGGESATRGYAIAILPPDVTITTETLPAGVAGVPYSQALTAAGGAGSYSWSLVSGNLPAGLTLSGTGIISGTPAAAGSTTFTVQASSGGRTVTRELTITVAAPELAITSASLADGIAGNPYSETLAASGGTGNYAWSLVTGSLPAGLTLSGEGVISGTPTAVGSSTFTVGVSSDTQQATRALTITVHSPAVSITTTTLPDAVAGQAYSQALTATGGTGTYSWSVAGGALPSGLTLSEGGLISGTPVQPGTSSFSVRASSGGQVASLALTLVVRAPPVVVTTTTLPPPVVGTPYQQQLSATGGTGPFFWSISAGSLPAGLSLSAAGMLSGTPTTAGTSSFTVRASNTGGSGTRDFTMVVLLPPVVITTSSLPGGTVGVPYSQALAASGGNGTFTWSIAAGALPAGLTLSPAGLISGTPTAAGTATFTVQAQSGDQTANTSLAITVAAAVPDVVITTSTLPDATLGAAYSQTLAATGGTGNYTWTITAGSLPPGLVLSTSGVIAGTPTTAGSSSFTVQASSGGLSDTQPLSITVVTAEPPVVITTTSLPDGRVGEAYSQALAATGGTGSYAWTVSAGSLPVGLELSNAGVLGGTPSAPGTSTFTVSAASGSGSDTQELSVTVTAAAVVVTTTALPDAQVGTAYTQTLTASGGAGSYTWSLLDGALPTGLNLSADGTISGTPTSPGTATFTVQAASGDLTGSRELSVTVVAPVEITTTGLPDGTVGEAYDQALAATGGDGSFTWTLDSGSLPAGLTLSAGGAITGTPTTAGTSTFTVRATSGALSDTQELQLTINEAGGDALVITTTALPDGVRNVPYSFTLGATGGTGEYSWEIVEGGLPNGLALSTSGVISGTPANPGNHAFTVRASSGSQTATQLLTLRIRQ